jgi:hypothetical protein
MTTVLIVAAALFLLVAAVEATRFAVRYSRETGGEWHNNREGRHLMRFTVALAVALWGTLILAVVPLPDTLELLMGVGVYAWLAFELHHRNTLLTLNQRGE